MYTETADIETSSDEYAMRFSGEVGKFFLEVQTKLTLELLNDFPSATILDVGGGHGQIAVPLVENGYEVTVTGSDDRCRNRLERLLKPGTYHYRTCDSLHLPFEANSFDIVVAFRLLPHVTAWAQLISELCRVASHSVIFDYPDRRSFNVLYNILFSLKKKMEGNTRTFHLFTRRDIARHMRASGFGTIVFRPEFFLPMVLHRKLDNRSFSSLTETLFSGACLTRLFGSPVIVRSDFDHAESRS
jgi:ubiquinone/menaquinone biosynthesis C-methylase UbiE